MATVKRLVLDVLKPRKPNVLDFSRTIADIGDGYTVESVVLEVDERTETLIVEVEGEVLDFEAIEDAITDAGASLHSIDEVLVVGGEEAGISE